MGLDTGYGRGYTVMDTRDYSILASDRALSE